MCASDDESFTKALLNNQGNWPSTRRGLMRRPAIKFCQARQAIIQSVTRAHHGRAHLSHGPKLLSLSQNFNGLMCQPFDIIKVCEESVLLVLDDLSDRRRV